MKEMNCIHNISLNVKLNKMIIAIIAIMSIIIGLVMLYYTLSTMYDSFGLTVFFGGIGLGAIILGFMLFGDVFYKKGYEKGQIDYANGEVKIEKELKIIYHTK